MQRITDSQIQTIRNHIQQHGPIACVRVSSAQARGAARQYAYWGAARYEARITRAGHISLCAQERASSDRRSERLAVADAREIAADEGRVVVQGAGPVSGSDWAALYDYAARPVDHLMDAYEVAQVAC
jgi:hypothetical protein